MLAAGKGGGGGMGGGAATGGMHGGAATGGIGGGAFGGVIFNNPASSFGTSGGTDWPGGGTQSSYYTDQCVTAVGECSFVAPASLRASSLRAGAQYSCSDGLSQGQIK